LNPTTDTARDSGRGRARKPAVAIARIGAEPAPLELKARLTGETASAFKDYQRAYLDAHGEVPEPGALVAQILGAFMKADRGFLAWRKANPEALG
jgi:hypothetical protein